MRGRAVTSTPSYSMRIKTLCSSLCIQKTLSEESLRNFLSHEENSLSTLSSSAILVKATETLTPPPRLEKVIPYFYDIGKCNPVRGRQEMQANSKVTPPPRAPLPPGDSSLTMRGSSGQGGVGDLRRDLNFGSAI